MNVEDIQKDAEPQPAAARRLNPLSFGYDAVGRENNLSRPLRN